MREAFDVIAIASSAASVAIWLVTLGLIVHHRRCRRRELALLLDVQRQAASIRKALLDVG